MSNLITGAAKAREDL